MTKLTFRPKPMLNTKGEQASHVIKLLAPGSTIPTKYRVKLYAGPKKVLLSRTVEDVQNGVEGNSCLCGNSQCALRLQNEFSHPVYFVSTTYYGVYVVYELNKNNHPTKAFVYEHKDKSPRKFDLIGGKEALIQSNEAEMDIILSPPRKSQQDRSKTFRKNKTITTRAKHSVRRVPKNGENARYAAAGLNIKNVS